MTVTASRISQEEDSWLPTSSSPPVTSRAKKFRRQPEHEYGWRYVKQIDEDGKETWIEVPLTLEDLLHPEMEDVILN